MTRGLGLVFYGGEGIGKTGVALQLSILGPLTCFSIGESGYEDLEIIEEVPQGCENIKIDSWDGLMSNIKKIKEGVVVIDSLSGLQKILFDYVCKTVYGNDWDKFTSYWKGQRVDCPVFLDNLLQLLDAMRNRGIHVVIIGHMVTTTESNTLGADYLSHVIDMDQGDKGGLRSCVTKWAQAVIFMNIDVAITRATELAKDKTVMEGKAKDDDNRLMFTTKAPGHSAKNRLQLPAIIPMGESAKEAFKNLWNCMPKAYKDLL